MADPVTTQIMDSVVQILQQEQQMIGHLIRRLRLRRDVSPLVFGTYGCRGVASSATLSLSLVFTIFRCIASISTVSLTACLSR